MDGVLIDSEPVWQEAIDRVFGAWGITLDADMKAHTMGMGNDESVRHVLALHPHVQADVADVCRRIDAVVLRRIGEGIGGIPGANNLVRELAARGVPLALVSTSAPALMQAVVRAHRLEGLFRVVLSSEEVGPGKPDPAVYREAIRRLQADAAQSVAIEDTVNGARSAHGAGLRVIGFTRDPSAVAAMRKFVWQVAPDFAVIRAWVHQLEWLTDGWK
jgi:sugar-phosphatase